MPRLGQQEETNLGDVRAGRDVDQIVLALGVERIRAREVVECPENLVEVPGVANFDLMRPHFGFRRDASNILASALNNFGVPALMEQLEAIDQELLVLTEGDRGTPSIPSLGAVAGIEIGAD